MLSNRTMVLWGEGHVAVLQVSNDAHCQWVMPVNGIVTTVSVKSRQLGRFRESCVPKLSLKTSHSTRGDLVIWLQVCDYYGSRRPFSKTMQ